MSAELERMTRMFQAACEALGEISEELGLDPEDGGGEPIIEAIRLLKQGINPKQILRGPWENAPVKTEWGDGMKQMVISLDDDSTARIFAHEDDAAKIDAMFIS